MLLTVSDSLKNSSFVALLTQRHTKQKPETNTWNGNEIFSESIGYLTLSFVNVIPYVLFK